MFCDPEEKTPLIKAGDFYCSSNGTKKFPIVEGIPRFVDRENYASNFGDQWNTFRSTQLDSHTGLTLSKERLSNGTGWSHTQLEGKKVLEIGCGAGRFTEILLSCNAEVWAIDYSTAVDACYRNNLENHNFHIAQADLFRLPFKPESFDFVLMYGVMQHTPDPYKAMMCALDMAADGGKIAIDSYIVSRPCRWTSKYYWRWFTTKLAPSTLRKIVHWYIPIWLPVDNAIGHFSPLLQKQLSKIVPCWNYTGLLPLSKEQLRDWAILDTYDALGARYDIPQRKETIESWLSPLKNISYTIKKGGNGLEVSIIKGKR